MLSEIDRKMIDRLYDLMREVEKKDSDTAGALRWAILTLEQADQQVEEVDLFFRLALMTEQTINSIMNSGVFNEIVKGYLVAAMQDMDFERTTIQKTANTLDDIFEEMGSEAARKAYRKLWVKEM